MLEKILDSLREAPVIAAIKDKKFEDALKSDAKIIFLFSAGILTVRDRIKAAHDNGKFIFVHIDLTEGISRDRHGVEYLAHCGVDGILSTKAALIRCANEYNLITVQRFFVYDTQGVDSIDDMLETTRPDIIEIMPGVIGKIIERFSKGTTPLIAGGLIESKKEVISAINFGAYAVSTGKEELWNI